jgi:DNA-binding NtrC family response regulator
MSKILIIEDDADLCETYMDILERDDFKIETVNSTVSALSRMRRFMPDLILLDMQLADGSGTVILGYLESANLDNRVKVIIISGHLPVAERMAKYWKVARCLAKPVSHTQLRETVMSCLER